MVSETSKRMKRSVREWFKSEGSKVETITDPRAEFVFKVKFQRFFFTVVRPNDQKYIQIETQVLISPQHLKVMNAEKMRQFQIEALRYSFSQGIGFGFMQPRPGQKGPKPPGPGFVISERVYDDGFSEDRLWHVMRKLHTSVDMAIAILNEITGITPGKPEEAPDTTPSYYT